LRKKNLSQFVAVRSNKNFRNGSECDSEWTDIAREAIANEYLARDLWTISVFRIFIMRRWTNRETNRVV